MGAEGRKINNSLAGSPPPYCKVPVILRETK